MNYYHFGDPLKILLIQNNIVEIKFLEFLSSSNIDFNLKNLFFFIFNLGIPNNYFSNFSISLGFGFFLLLSCFFIKSIKNKYLLFFIILIFLSNFIFERISINENHGRNYILIFYLLSLIFINNIDKFPRKIILMILSIQLVITQSGFVFYNYEIYIKKRFNEISYNLENEKKINLLYEGKKDTIIITSLDGNLFKQYIYYNIDYFNFDKKFFYKKIRKSLMDKKEIDKVVLILKKKENIFDLDNFNKLDIFISSRTRNPSKKVEIHNYQIYEISVGSFFKIIDDF